MHRLLLIPVLLLACCASPPAGSTVEHVLLTQLGEEHIANAVLRQGSGGERIVVWGNRMLEWAVAPGAEMQVVVPVKGEQEYSNGGCAMDVDEDGIEDIVVARGEGWGKRDPDILWFKEQPGAGTWNESPIAHLEIGGHAAPHDILPFSMAGPDGTCRGIATVISRKNVALFTIPADPAMPWSRHDIAALPPPRQSGLVVGDIAGHGRPDMVCGMYWLECPADPAAGPWPARRYADWDANKWGGMAKPCLGDMNNDGRLDIVVSEAEIPGSRLAVFQRNVSAPDELWTCTMVDTGLYCPHSVALADLNGDGLTDIVVGEMTAGGWSYPLHENPEIFAYINRGNLQFDKQVLVEGWGVHELKIAPRPGGTFLMYAADEIQPQKFSGMNTHVSYWNIQF